MKNNNRFNFFVPVTIDKGKKIGADGYPEELIIEGVISTDDKDEDDEVLNPNGAILSGFLKHGMITQEHLSKQDFSYIVGEPIDCQVKGNKVYMKGKLYKSNPKARAIYDTALMLEKEKSDRKLGFSIEGKKLQTAPGDEKTINKYRILHATITATPKNHNTYLSIVKGTSAEPYIEPEFDETANGGAEYLLDVTKPDGSRITIDKEFNIKIVEKAMSAGSTTGTENNNKDTSGAALKRESLRKKLTTLQPDFIKAIIEISKHADKLSKKTLESVRGSIKKSLDISKGGEHAQHKYIRKEGDKYIYNEGGGGIEEDKDYDKDLKRFKELAKEASQKIGVIKYVFEYIENKPLKEKSRFDERVETKRVKTVFYCDTQDLNTYKNKEGFKLLETFNPIQK